MGLKSLKLKGYLFFSENVNTQFVIVFFVKYSVVLSSTFLNFFNQRQTSSTVELDKIESPSFLTLLIMPFLQWQYRL